MNVNSVNPHAFRLAAYSNTAEEQLSKRSDPNLYQPANYREPPPPYRQDKQSFSRSSYPKDKIETIENPEQLLQFNGRIVKSHESTENFDIYIIDDIFKITTISETRRMENINYWDSKRKKFSPLSLFGALVSVFSFVNMVKTKIDYVWFKSFIVFLVGMTILFYEKSKSIRIQNQIDAWRNPVQKFAEKRRELKEKDFRYIFDHDLKKYAIQEELIELWLAWVVKYHTPYTSNADDDHAELKKYYDVSPLGDKKFVDYISDSEKVRAEIRRRGLLASAEAARSI